MWRFGFSVVVAYFYNLHWKSCLCILELNHLFYSYVIPIRGPRNSFQFREPLTCWDRLSVCYLMGAGKDKNIVITVGPYVPLKGLEENVGFKKWTG